MVADVVAYLTDTVNSLMKKRMFKRIIGAINKSDLPSSSLIYMYIAK